MPCYAFIKHDFDRGLNNKGMFLLNLKQKNLLDVNCYTVGKYVL